MPSKRPGIKSKNNSQNKTQITKNKLLFTLTGINLFVWILSFYGVGYPLFKSLLGESKFSDFTLAIYYSDAFFDPRLLHTEPPFDYAMTPPLALFYGVLSRTSWQLILLTLNLVSILLIVVLLQKLVGLDKRFFLILLNSFPLAFCILRGSGDLWLLALLLLSFFSYQKGFRTNASILLGLLIACKPQFAAFGLIYLVNKDLKSILSTFFSSILAFISPLFLLGNFGVLAQLKVIGGLAKNYQNSYTIGDGGLMWDNSLVGFQKVVYYTIMQPNPQEAVSFGHFAAISQVILSLLLLTPIVWLCKFDPSHWGEIWLVSTLMFIFLSPISASYRLLFFIPAFSYYFYKQTNKRLLWLMALLFIPKSILWVKTSNGHEFIGESLINPLIMILIYWHVVSPRIRKLRIIK